MLLDRRRFALLLAVPIFAACSIVPPREPRLRATDAWARPVTPLASGPGQPESINGAVYLTLVNDGGEPDRLVGAATEVARVAEVHETLMQPDNVMQMQPVAGLSVPARGSIVLKPGGLHIMLIDVGRALRPGDSFSVELRFERSPALRVPVTVQEP